MLERRPQVSDSRSERVTGKRLPGNRGPLLSVAVAALAVGYAAILLLAAGHAEIASWWLSF